MPILDLPKIAPLSIDERGRLSCEQVTGTMKTGSTINSKNELQIVMATLCHYQCDSRAS